MTDATVDVWLFDARAPALRLLRDASGRPIVAGHPELSVSLSHSGEMTLVAIGEGCRVGVDVEVVRDRGIAALPKHALTAVERRELERRKAAWLQTLLSYWTRKEAILKAAGVGLAVEPNLIELPPPGSTHVVALPEKLGRPEAWCVREIALDGHVAAVAADASYFRMNFNIGAENHPFG